MKFTVISLRDESRQSLESMSKAPDDDSLLDGEADERKSFFAPQFFLYF